MICGKATARFASTLDLASKLVKHEDVFAEALLQEPEIQQRDRKNGNRLQTFLDNGSVHDLEQFLNFMRQLQKLLKRGDLAIPAGSKVYRDAQLCLEDMRQLSSPSLTRSGRLPYADDVSRRPPIFLFTFKQNIRRSTSSKVDGTKHIGPHSALLTPSTLKRAIPLDLKTART